MSKTNTPGDDPVWIKLPEAVRLSSVGRSTLYEAVKSGAIKSSLVRQRGKVRGIRLINRESLLAFIEQGILEEAKNSESV